MKLRICLLFFCCLASLTYAYGANGDHDKDKNKDKVKCKKMATDPTIEEFVFILPSPSPQKACAEHKAFRNSVVDFYKWYLQNRDRISAGMAQNSSSKDLVPPFNISWQTLHEYFEYIQKNYTSWIDNIEVNQFEANSIDYNTAKESGIKKPVTGAPNSNLSNTVN